MVDSAGPAAGGDRRRRLDPQAGFASEIRSTLVGPHGIDDWSAVSPTRPGSVFHTVGDIAERRKGAHHWGAL